MADYRNVWALILAVGLLQVAGGLLGVVTPLGLEALGLRPRAIGAIAALFAAGFMVGALTAPRAIHDFGNIRIFSASAAVCAAGTLLMYLGSDPWVWTAVRLAQGIALAWMFASAESWMSVATPAKARGGVLGFYHVIAKAALLVGPFLIGGAAVLSASPYIWGALFFCLCLIPVCLTRRVEPPRHGGNSMGPRRMLKLAPAAVAAVFFAGVINTGALALLPLYAQRSGLPESLGQSETGAAALAMAAAWLGGLISQWPLGRLSDRVDRRVVVAAMGIASGVSALALGLMGNVMAPWVMLTLLGLWGAGSLSFYGIAVAHGVDRTQPEEISSLMSGLLFVWAIGSVIGPPVAGAAMHPAIGPGGLFLFVAISTALLVVSMLVRRVGRPPAPKADRENWGITQPTAVTGVEIDPRTDTDPQPAPRES